MSNVCTEKLICQTKATPIRQELAYQPPFDWETVLAFFRTHHLPYLESVDDKGYERVIDTNLGAGWLRVEHDAQRRCLCLSVWNGTEADLAGASAVVTKMFDLDAQPDVLREVMDNDSSLSLIWNRYPGLRVARSWNAFEALFTTVLGQVVSVALGRVLTGELMKAAGSQAIHPKTSEKIYLFPTTRQIVTEDLSGVRTSEARRATIRSLAQLVESGDLDCIAPPPATSLKKILLSVPGVGAWTSEYVAMRGFGDDDAFPATDYVLKQELKQHAAMDVNRTRPFRAYAAMALWKTFAEGKRKVRNSQIAGQGLLICTAVAR